MATPLDQVTEINEKTETCPVCGSEMRLRNRKSDNAPFWGCSRFPNCRGIKPYQNGNGNSQSQPVQKKTFKPSKYQIALFDFVKGGKGNAVVEATAGSGKTTSLVEALQYTDPNSNVAFVAFNKSIARELQRRAPSHVHTSTLHSLGHANIRAIFPNCKVDDYKCKNILDEIANNAPSLEYLDALKQNTSTILRLVSLLKSTLLEPTNSNLEWLEDRYGITTNGDGEIIRDAARRIFNESVENTQVIDFDDMCYFCAIGIVPCKKFDFLFIDELQDVSVSQREMILKSVSETGRVIGIGDRNQSIYSWRAADSQAIPNLIEALHATVLPLSITYRCPKAVVELVNREFPHIAFEASQTAIEGTVTTIRSTKMLYDLEQGDMVLCRTNAPLVEPCFTLIRRGVKAIIRGRDIGKGLQILIAKISKKSKANSLSEFLYALKLYESNEVGKLIATEKTQQAATLQDQTETIFALADGCTTIDELNNRIDSVFSDDNAPAVVFSSIHRAKGDEANRVYIIKPELLPHPLAKQEWQKQEETCIKFVAYTRAKKELFFAVG